MKFHVVYDKGYGWMWWYGDKFGPDMVSMGWYLTKDECLAAINKLKQVIPLASIEVPSSPKSPPFTMPRLRLENL